MEALITRKPSGGVNQRRSEPPEVDSEAGEKRAFRRSHVNIGRCWAAARASAGLLWQVARRSLQGPINVNATAEERLKPERSGPERLLWAV